MISLGAYKNMPVALFGLGKAGEAAAIAFAAAGAEVWMWDDGAASVERMRALAKANAAYAKLWRICPFSEWPWQSLKHLVLSPGVPLYAPQPHPVVERAKHHNVEVIGEVEVLCRACPEAKYIGITGTNGKSTTTALIGHILKECGVRAQVGGNLGTPALALEHLGAGGVYVLEMSSYQLDLMKGGEFDIALLLNFSPDHIDRHGSMEGYIAAKRRILAQEKRGGVAILGVDDADSRKIAEEWRAAGRRMVAISSAAAVEGGVYALEGTLTDATVQPARSYDISGIPSLLGQHNMQNAAAAFAACRSYGLEGERIAAAMRSFPGLAHRMERIAVIDGVAFVNDSKATNADSTEKALRSYTNIYWIAGGKPKEGGIAALEPLFPRVRQAFLIGEAEEAFARTLEGKLPYARCGTLAHAFAAAAGAARKEKLKDAVVLLSPACASFDQWKNFEERGEGFRALTLALQHKDEKVGGAA